MPVAGPGHFHREYEEELERWLQRRFGWLCVVFATIELLHLGGSVVSMTIQYSDPPITTGTIAGIVSGLAGMSIVSAFLLLHLRRNAPRQRLLRDAALMVLTLGLLVLVEAAWVASRSGDESVNVLFRLFLWHLIACLILPWRPLESVRPMVPLLLLWAAGILRENWHGDLVGVTVALTFSPLILLPGLGVSALRLRLHGARFRAEHLGRQFLRMRRELRHARGVHESMFPRPYDDGFVRLDYIYSPALDVGGDFVHLHVAPNGTATLTLLDVTGHGITAALTVNRLHGELERLRAEEPRIAPVELMRALNRYVQLTLARHNVYATAVCIEIDPHVGELRYANGGHPPLLLHRADGSVVQLDSTGIMLGAVADEEYECTQESKPLRVGDAVIALTDGAFEAMDRSGAQLGLDALASAIRGDAPSPDSPKKLAALADRHSGGRSEDDVLVAMLTLGAMRTRTPRSVATATVAVRQ